MLPFFPSENCSKRFQIGLIALRGPKAEYGVIAAATALVELDKALPAHAPQTHHLVFAAAEKIFRALWKLNPSDVAVRESSFLQAIHDMPNPNADGCLPGAKVWLCAERY